MMDINSRKLEEVIPKEFVLLYEKLHKNIWDRLVHINTSIQILEKLDDFPFEYINTPTENIFWPMVRWNFLYTSVVMLHALMNDTREKSSTLDFFKDQLVDSWLLPEEQDDFKAKWESCKFSDEIETLKKCIIRMRHIVIAHVAFNRKTKSFPEVSGVSVSDLRQFYTSAHKCFKVCCFGREFPTSLYIHYSADGNSQMKDIDKILKLILKDSDWINEPEKLGLDWIKIKEQKTPEELHLLNKYRKMLGMTEV